MNGPILLCMGTRPEIIKMAPVFRALKNSPLPVQLFHTGQHEEMAWPLYEFFEMQPDHILRLARKSDALAHLSAQLLEEIHVVLQRVRPAAVLVHGDTSSALMTAMAAFYHQIPVGHVEAGLRTGEMYDPFPEEKNREMIGRLARWHFSPTQIAAENLRREGVTEKNIYRVGNTIVDATLWGVKHLNQLPSNGIAVLPDSLAQLPAVIPGRRLIVVTAHRRENWGNGIASIAKAIRGALESNVDFVVVWPVHANPKVRQTVFEAFSGLRADVAERLFLCEPLNYPALLWVMKHAWLIMTDSGGIQEEAVAIHVPVFVLRETTERPELLAAGGGILVGTDACAIADRLNRLGSDDIALQRMRDVSNPFGDGHASEYIRDILIETVDANSMATDKTTYAAASASLESRASHHLPEVA